MWTAFKDRLGRNAAWLATALAVALVALWLFRISGSTEATVATTSQGEAAPTARVPAPLTPQPHVPVARLDTAGRLTIEDLPVEKPREAQATVTVGSSHDTTGRAATTLLLRRRRVWLPELRRPGAAFSVDVLGEGAPGEGTAVTVTPTPRPLFDWHPRPLAGVGLDAAGTPRLYLGADLARAGPLHAQLGLTAALPGQRPGPLRLDLAPAAGLRLREGLMLTAGYQLRARRPLAALSYRF